MLMGTPPYSTFKKKILLWQYIKKKNLAAKELSFWYQWKMSIHYKYKFQL